MIPINIQVSRTKVKFKGQAYSSYVQEGGHKAFTNIFILFKDLLKTDAQKMCHSNAVKLI